MPAAFEDSLILSDRWQDNYWSVVSDLVSLIERTRSHRQVSDLAKQIEGTTDASVDVLDDGASPKITQTSPGAIAISAFAKRCFFCSWRDLPIDPPVVRSLARRS